MISSVLVFVILAATSARNNKDVSFENWRGYKPGDRIFYFPGEDGKIHKIDSWAPIDRDFISVTPASVRNNKHVRFRNWKGYKNGDRIFYFPGDNGKIYKIDSWEPIDRDAIRNYTCWPVNNGYWLYTRSNAKEKQILIMGNKSSVRNSNFDPNKPTVFTSHGWLGDGNTEMNQLLTKVFLKDADVNVIVLDWSGLSKMGYVTAKESVPKVGRMYGQFIYWLHKNFHMALQNIHLVGHSLGGHLVGSAGRELQGAAQRITALDPAGPLWCYDKRRLSRTDAHYVEVIHTNAYMAGYPKPCGHSDHYPDGGSFMTGCHVLDLICHHSRSWKYMAASVEHNEFLANKCSNVWEAFNDRCSGAGGLMGNSFIAKKQSGLYRINTLADYPYIDVKIVNIYSPLLKLR